MLIPFLKNKCKIIVVPRNEMIEWIHNIHFKVSQDYRKVCQPEPCPIRKVSPYSYIILDFPFSTQTLGSLPSRLQPITFGVFPPAFVTLPKQSIVLLSWGFGCLSGWPCLPFCHLFRNRKWVVRVEITTANNSTTHVLSAGHCTLSMDSDGWFLISYYWFLICDGREWGFIASCRKCCKSENHKLLIVFKCNLHLAYVRKKRYPTGDLGVVNGKSWS